MATEKLHSQHANVRFYQAGSCQCESLHGATDCRRRQSRHVAEAKPGDGSDAQEFASAAIGKQ